MRKIETGANKGLMTVSELRTLWSMEAAEWWLLVAGRCCIIVGVI